MYPSGSVPVCMFLRAHLVPACAIDCYCAQVPCQYIALDSQLALQTMALLVVSVSACCYVTVPVPAYLMRTPAKMFAVTY